MKAKTSLNRIFISGFKNLFNINIILDKIIGIFGHSGVGKTNLFKAISFIFTFIKASSFERNLMLSNQDFRSYSLKL